MTSTALGVPRDYDELARRYMRDIRAVVRRCIPWGQDCDVDDTVQDILRRFTEVDVIAQFDPGKASARSRDPFRALILAKVPLYCRGKAERLAVVGHRELLIADAPAGDGRASFIDTVPDYGQARPVSRAGEFERLRAMLDDSRPVPPGHPGKLVLLDELYARLESGKPVTPCALAKRFRTDSGTAARWLAEIREDLRPQVAPDYRCARTEGIMMGGLELTPDEVREAARLLREAPGNQVVKVWARAGHPLAAAGRTWYLAPAKAELEACPHLRGEKGGHYEGGHGSPVKRGLIHWLERMVGDLDETEPLSPEWAAVAAALGGLPGAAGEAVAEALAVLGAMFGEA